jgi:hypothetical protein
MFRLLKLKPPHGWAAVAWELGIVTLGVIIALAAQQWAEGRSWKAKARDTTAALRDEVSNHYAWSVEWRAVEPCIVGQIDRLEQRVLASGQMLSPAPVHPDQTNGRFVIRLPSKEYHSTTWEAAINDGVSTHLDPFLRKELSGHYAQAKMVMDLSRQNNIDQSRLLALSKALPLDPSVRFSIVEMLEQMRGRTEFMGLLSGQMIDHIAKAGMTPQPRVVREALSRYPTYRFCRAEGLPTRSVEEAMKALPN